MYYLAVEQNAIGMVFHPWSDPVIIMKTFFTRIEDILHYVHVIFSIAY